MKKLIIIVSILTLSSCSIPNVKETETNYIINKVNTSLKIIVVDSCEYLYGDWGYSSVLTHKGDCKYCSKK